MDLRLVLELRTGADVAREWPHLSCGGAFVRGDIHVKPGATLGINPAGTAVFSLSGLAPQAIDIQGTLANATSAVLDVNNATGVSLVTDVSWTGSLLFTSGWRGRDSSMHSSW